MDARYPIILEGLHERFKTIPGIVDVLPYQPSAIHDAPLLFSMLDEVEFEEHGQIAVATYRVLHRLVFFWQDAEGAEEQLAQFVDAPRLAVLRDPHLGGRVKSGAARVGRGTGVFWTIGGTVHRCIDYTSVTVDKVGLHTLRSRP